MRRSTIRARVALALWIALSAWGCAAEPPAPDRPTWVDDVEPILRGNCFSCHGSTDHRGDGPRFDVYDPTAPAYQGLGPFLEITGAATPGMGGGYLMATKIAIWANRGPTGVALMPPPPATPLSVRDHDVLLKWSRQSPPERGTRASNAKPAVALRGMPRRAGANVEVELVVTDGDHDQVLGRLACGPATGIIRTTGTSKVVIEMAPAGMPLAASVSDGQDRTDNVMLGTCP